MRNIATPSALFASLLLSGHAQAQLTFQRSIGGNGEDGGGSVIATTDQGYAVVATTSSFGAGGDDIYLIKLDANGDTLWTRTYGGTDDEYGASVQETFDGGYIVMGDTRSFGAQDQDLYIVKTDEAGAPQWSMLYGAPGNEYARAISQTSDGGYLLAGSTTQGAGVLDAYVVRTSIDGALLWTKTYGGPLEDDGNALRLTSDGGFILAGITLSYGAGGVDVFVMKRDADGTGGWTACYGAAGDDYAFSIEEAADGGYYLAGTTTSAGAGGYDCCLMLIGTTGSFIWAKTYGSPANDMAGSVQPTAGGGYALLGQSFGFGVASDVYLVGTLSDGTLEWSRIYGGSGYEYESTLIATADGGYLISAGEDSFDASGNVYLIKTDALGNSGCSEGTTTTVPGALAMTEAFIAAGVSSGGAPLAATTPSSRGGIINTLCSTAAVPEASPSAAVAVYPVPFSTSFQVSGTSAGGSIVITDITGKICGTQRTSQRGTLIDASGLKPGPYLLAYIHSGERVVLPLLKE